MEKIKRFLIDEDGGQGIEYVLIAILVALVLAFGAQRLGNALNFVFSTIGERMEGANIPNIPGN